MKLYLQPPGDFTKLPAWLIKVATNLAYNRLRDEKNRRRREGTDDRQQVRNDDDLLRLSDVAEVRQVLDELSPRDRICLILKFSGFSYKEIASVTGISRNSIGKALARSQAKFRLAYERKTQNVL